MAMTGVTRRSILASGGAAAAGFVLMPTSLAANLPRANRPRLVVMIARGGLDGLSFAPPVGDPRYVQHRRDLAILRGDALKIDGHFGLHPELRTVHRLARSGQARIAPAAALWTPERSHFHAQDMLEAGVADLGGGDGWLRRAADLLWRDRAQAVSIGPRPPLVLAGATPGATWNIDPVESAPSGFLDALAELYETDPWLSAALANWRGLQAVETAEGPADPHPEIRAAEAAARFLAAPEGASVAALIFEGFDSHFAQGGAEGGLAGRFAVLDKALHRLETGLGDAWGRTVVLLVTEFGRTVAPNGVGGTDHGTASVAMLAGGAVRAGGLLGDWPGLAPAALFEGRDLRPALDLRALFKGVLSGHFGLDERALAERVFPESAGVRPLQGLIA